MAGGRQMIWLVIGVALWAYSHLMKRVTPGLRASLGDGPGKGVVAVLSLLAIGAMIYGYRTAAVVDLWYPPEFMRHINSLLMVIAVILVNMGYSRGVMRTWMRHPMLTSVKVWALAHLLVNGDLASLVLFGGLLAWAVVDVILINRMERAWVRPAPGPVVNDVIYVVVSAVLFGVIVYIHGWLGYPPMG
jgi:uncharacterized membrane protein